jgi:pantothenate synthetase
MTYPQTLTQPVTTNTHRVSIRAKFGLALASRNERLLVRRTALAVSEEARIHAQMRYRRMRYRHMAD